MEDLIKVWELEGNKNLQKEIVEKVNKEIFLVDGMGYTTVNLEYDINHNILYEKISTQLKENGFRVRLKTHHNHNDILVLEVSW